MMFPFEYPSEPHQRRHGPKGYADAASYSPWLRDEFSFRCVYCLKRETWTIRKGEFVVEHFVAQKWAPQRALEYDNLLYACQGCNLAKADQRVPDPLKYLLLNSVTVALDGTIRAKTAEARRLVQRLGLNDPVYCEYRRLIVDIVALASVADPALLRRLMAIPSDLPDLTSLRPPKGNSRPTGIANSFFAKARSEKK